MKALVAALVLMAATASAQVTITPASAVSGGGAFVAPLLAPTTADCTPGTVPYSFVARTGTGLASTAANQWTLCSGGSTNLTGTTTAVTALTDLVIPAANTYFFSGRGGLMAPSDGVITLRNNANTEFSRLNFGGTTSAFPAIGHDAGNTGLILRLADGTGNAWMSAYEFYPVNARITAGTGTGITVNMQGVLADVVYKVTVSASAFICAALTCDITIATLPARTVLLGVSAEIATVFACASTCTSSTLSMLLGKGAGASQYLASFDADAAVAVFGRTDAELGTEMVRAAAVQGGTYNGSIQSVVLRLTSGTGNIGTGAATNLSTGVITFYLTTERLP